MRVDAVKGEKRIWASQSPDAERSGRFNRSGSGNNNGARLSQLVSIRLLWGGTQLKTADPDSLNITLKKQSMKPRPQGRGFIFESAIEWVTALKVFSIGMWKYVVGRKISSRRVKNEYFCQQTNMPNLVWQFDVARLHDVHKNNAEFYIYIFVSASFD